MFYRHCNVKAICPVQNGVRPQQQLHVDASFRNVLKSRCVHLKRPNTTIVRTFEAVKGQPRIDLRTRSAKVLYISTYRHLLGCKHMDF